MEAAIIELIKNSPIAAALLITVFAFLRAMAKRDEDNNASRDRHIEANQEQAQAWSKTLNEITRENVHAIREVAIALEALKEVIREEHK